MNIKLILENEYGLKDIYIMPITYGLIDKNYKVTTSDGTFFFKVYNSITEASYFQLHNDLRILKNSGLPVPVEIIGNKNNVYTDVTYGLYEFVEGERYGFKVQQIESIADVISKLVRVGLPKCTKVKAKTLIENLPEIALNLNALAKTDYLPEEIQGICQFYYNLINKVQKKLSAYLPEKLDSLPLHPDFTERNLLFKGNSVVLICDWQGYGNRILLYEMVSAFTRFCTAKPFEGHLLENRFMSFKKILFQSIKLISSILIEYAPAFPWLLIHRQICNTPFRVHGLSGTNEAKHLLMKVLLWSKKYVEWVLTNETEVVDLLLENKKQ